MKDNNNIDDIFRSGLEDFKIEPSSKSWDSLSSELEKKRVARKRNNGFKLFSLALLLLLISYTVYNIYDSNKKSDTIVTDVKSTVSDNNTTSEILSMGAEPTASVNNKRRTADGNDASDKGDLTIENNPVSRRDNTSNVEKSDGISENSSSSDKKASDITDNTTNNNTAETKEIPVNNKSVSIEKNKTTDVVDKKISDDGIGVSIADQINKPNPRSLAETKEVNSSSTAVVVEADHLNSNNKSNEVQNNSTVPANVTTTETVNSDIQKEVLTVGEPEKQIPLAASTTPAPSESKSDSSSFVKKILSHMSAEIFYSPDYVNDKLKINDSYTGTASQNPDDYDNQKAAFSYSTGINIGYDVGKRWSILSGVFLSTFAQTAVYNTINVVADSVYRKVHRHGPGGGGGHGGGGHHSGGHGGNNPHQPPPGSNNHHYVIQTPCGAIDLYNRPPRHGPGNNQNGDTINIKTETHETIQFINIPLTVRYRFGQHKLSYFVEGGASMSIVQKDEVKIVIDDAYTEDNERDGLKNISYSLLFGAGVQYNFYKGLSMYLKPSLRYSITPVNQDNPMYSHPYYIGIGFGISVHF